MTRARPLSYTFTCPWCERDFRTDEQQRSYCSQRCSTAHRRAGYGLNRRQLQALRSRPAGPKGCATVEEWVSKGGVILRHETVPLPLGGVPVRSKVGDFTNGRVRR
jgi:hypothetical protein